MTSPNSSSSTSRQRSAPARSSDQDSPIEHYLRLILHRWWLVLLVFVVVLGVTVAVTSRLPDIYTSYTLILVDPQRVPEAYIKPTVTGDVRNRLGTLSQQILSATRLQKIIDALNLYQDEKKTLVREDLIAKMRSDINVNLVSDYGGSSQDLQAFRITYRGKDPRLVAQVTNQLASLFIEENLKVREQQATGTTEFLDNQLRETRKALEAQEAKLRDFKLKHIGEMPEHQTADLQILGQLQSQLQIESEGLSRAEQQKSYLQSMMAHAAPVVDLDDLEQPASRPQQAKDGATPSVDPNQARLAALLARGYTDQHPEVRRLKAQMAQQSTDLAKAAPAAPTPAETPGAEAPTGSVRVPTPPSRTKPPVPSNYINPVLQTQMEALDTEIAKHKAEQQRLRKALAAYQTKVEAIPVREQQIADLVRDYEISKAHYSQLLEKQLSAETATQLEVRQKGEKFSVLDPAQPAERPSSPNRLVLNSGGAILGFVLGLLLTLATEFLGASITDPEHITSACGLSVLEVIPVIYTYADRTLRKRRMILAAVSALIVVVLAGSAILIHQYRTQAF